MCPAARRGEARRPTTGDEAHAGFECCSPPEMESQALVDDDCTKTSRCGCTSSNSPSQPGRGRARRGSSRRCIKYDEGLSPVVMPDEMTAEGQHLQARGQLTPSAAGRKHAPPHSCPPSAPSATPARLDKQFRL